MHLRTATCALASLLAVSSAHAQSVTLYGILDTSVEVSNVGNGTTARMDSGGLLGSRFGMRGTEDIGGGNHINFVLEQGINSNNGTAASPTLAFSRQAWVGVSGVWGEVRAGRQNSPLYIPLDGLFDSFAVATIASALDSFLSEGVRYENAIYYGTPNLAGLTAQVMVGLRSADTHPQNGIDNYHVTAEYQRGPVSVGAGFQKVPAVVGNADLRALFVGGSYGFGPLRVYGVWHRATQSDDIIDKDAFTTSLSYMFSPSTMLSAGYGYVHDKTAAARNADQVGLMYWYFVSKQTTLYASAAFINNRTNGNYTMNGATTVGIPVAYAGADARGVQLGIQHRF
jgi:predicted porin